MVQHWIRRRLRHWSVFDQEVECAFHGDCEHNNATPVKGRGFVLVAVTECILMANAFLVADWTCAPRFADVVADTVVAHSLRVGRDSNTTIIISFSPTYTKHLDICTNIYICILYILQLYDHIAVHFQTRILPPSNRYCDHVPLERNERPIAYFDRVYIPFIAARGLFLVSRFVFVQISYIFYYNPFCVKSSNGNGLYEFARQISMTRRVERILYI